MILPQTLSSICLFCGSSRGNDPAYLHAASEMGKLLAQNKITVIFGGGSVGMMGSLAEATLDSQGEIIGVIPDFLAVKELLHPRVKNMHIVQSMHARKAMMNELSSAFIAMPGGLGTFEETFEVLTWGQLSLHQKPIGLLNTNGFYTPLYDFLIKTQQAGFISKTHLDLFVMADSPSELLEKMQSHSFPQQKEKMLLHSINHATRI